MYAVHDFSLLPPPCQYVHMQVAAIPMRWTSGAPEVLLITTRGKGRWAPPKGWSLTGSPNPECAAREAFEEAGVSGEVEPYALGEYDYEKRAGKSKLLIQASAYLLRVSHVHRDWPEREERQRAWFSVPTAKRLVGNVTLGPVLDEAARRFAASTDVRTAAMLV